MKFIEKLAKKHNNLVGEPPATLAFIGDSVTQGCFEIIEGGKGIDIVFENKSAYSTRTNEILHTLFPLLKSWLVNADLPFILSQIFTIRTEKSIELSTRILFDIFPPKK